MTFKEYTNFNNHMDDTYLFELVANKLECLIDGIRMSCDSYNALRARSVADVDLGPTLQIAKERMKQCTTICLLFGDSAVLNSRFESNESY